jgi:acetoin utilization protein AcuB
MIVQDIMTTKLVTVAPDDTLSHAANLLRQYQIHHLPVVRQIPVPVGAGAQKTGFKVQKTLLVLRGLLTSQDIDLVVALDKQRSSGDLLQRPWYEKQVGEVMHSASTRVTPVTNAGAAAELLVERGWNCLLVVEYQQMEGEVEWQPILVGLLTRSDLLLALARAMGIFEPGMQLLIPLPLGDMTPLAKTLLLTTELHIHVHSIMVAPQSKGPRVATLRLGTINPTPLLVRMREENISYTFADPLLEGDAR